MGACSSPILPKLKLREVKRFARAPPEDVAQPGSREHSRLDDNAGCVMLGAGEGRFRAVCRWGLTKAAVGLEGSITRAVLHDDCRRLSSASCLSERARQPILQARKQMHSEEGVKLGLQPLPKTGWAWSQSQLYL